MAYIPPHRRLLASSSTSTTPTFNASSSSSVVVASSSSSSNVQDHDQPKFVPLPISWSPHSVRKFVLFPPPPSPLPLQFQPYQGSYFSHLHGSPLYTLKQGAADQDTDPSLESPTTSFAIDQNAAFSAQVVQYLVQTLQCDLTSVIERLLKTRVDNVIPDFLLKFGCILFHPRDRVWFDWERDYTPDVYLIGKHVQTRITKTFFDRVSADKISALWETVSRDASRIRKTQRYYIQVEDQSRPDQQLLCSCSISSDAPKPDRIKNAETSQEDSLQKQLRIRKVRVGGPVRHMVADIACIGKCQDLRLMVYTEEQSLTDEDMSHLQACISHAVVDEDEEGDLTWPEDGFASFSNQFKLMGDNHQTCYSFQGEGVKWKLFKSESGTGILQVKPILLKELLKGSKESCSSDDVILSLNKLLEVAWKCLSSATNDINLLPMRHSGHRSFIVIPHSSPEQHQILQFQSYQGNLFFHPRGFPLYTLKEASAAADTDSISSEESRTAGFAVDENAAQVVHSLLQTLQDDIAAVIQRLKTRRLHNDIPDIFLRFGRIFFHPGEKASSLDWKQHYTAEYVEKHFQDIATGKLFVYRVPFSAIPPLWWKARRDGLQKPRKRRYFVKVEDKSRPDTYLLCKCSILSDARKSVRLENAETPQENSDDLKRLQLKKVLKDFPIGHMVAHIACLGKSRDLELSFSTRACLSDEDMSRLEACINHAVIDEAVEGGLKWPEDAASVSFSDRFELLGSFHMTCFSFREGDVECKLSRNDSYGWIIMEVKHIVLKEFLKGRRECSLDDVMESLKKLFEVAWKLSDGLLG